MTGRNAPERSGRLVLGLILLGLGILLFLGQLSGFTLLRFSWPLIFPAIGLAFFLGMVLGGKDAGGLAVPGSILVMLGLIFYYQDATGRWESWAYIWALIPFAVGVGVLINGLWAGQPATQRDGARLMGIGLIMFLIGLAFFETVAFRNVRPGSVMSYAGPAALVLLGVLVLGRTLMGRGERESLSDGPSPAERDVPADEGR